MRVFSRLSIRVASKDRGAGSRAPSNPRNVALAAGLVGTVTLSLLGGMPAAVAADVGALAVQAAPVAIEDEDITPTEPALLEERTTATSSTWVQPDGSLRTEMFTTPVNFEDAQGDWHPIENDLVPSSAPGVAVENAANDYSVRLPDDAGTKAVRFVSDGSWVSFRMEGLDGSPAVDGAEATYTDLPNASEVVYEATSLGLKESIVLDQAPAMAPTYSFTLQLSEGLQPELDPSGALIARAQDGSVVFTLPAPFMFDSATPEPARSMEVSYGLAPAPQGVTGWRLTVTPNQGWLTSPDRVYPIVIDPTVTTQNVVRDCWINESSPTSSYCGAGADWLKVGHTGSAARRALVKFKLDEIPANATVTSADLMLYLDAAQSTTSSNADYVARRVTKDWDSTTTWNRATSASGGAWTAAGGDFIATGGTGLTLSGAGTGYRRFTATAMVNAWLGGTANYGMLVKQSPENVNNVLSFVSTGSSDQNKWPKLDVTYTEPVVPAAESAGDREFFTYVTEQLTDRLTAKVNVGNGNLLVSAGDLSVPGIAGLDLNLTRYYNSSMDTSTSGGDLSKLGPGWSHNLGASVRLEFPNADTNRVLFYGPSGYRVRFEKSGAGTGANYIRYAPGLAATMRFDDASQRYKLTWRNKQEYLFKTNGQLDAIRDKQGNQLTMSYNTTGALAGTLAEVDDTRGRSAFFTYDANNMLSKVEIRANGSTLIRYAYDYYTATSPVRLKSTWVDYVAPSLLPTSGDSVNIGAKTTYDYDTNGRLKSIEDPRDAGTSTSGGTATVQYDAAGRVWKFNRLTESTSIPDSTTTYTYTTTTEALPTACSGEGTHSTLVDGKRIDVSDTTRYCVDDRDRVRRVVDAKGHVRKRTYTPNSNVATFDGSGLGSGGTTFSYEYDSNDNPTKVTTPSGGVATATYGDTDNPTMPTAMSDFDVAGNASSPTWQYDYDSKGNLIEAKALLGSGTGDDIVYRYCWDGKGQLQRIDPIDAAGTNSVSLDNNTSDGCGTASQGNDTLYTYDYDGHLTQVDPPGSHRTTTYTYDTLSRVKTITDGRGVRTTFTYDALGHVVAETFADDPTDSVTPPTGTASATVTWAYDAAGNMTSLDDPEGFTNFTYDELNRVTSQQDQDGPASDKTYTYDPADNVLTVDVADEPEATKYTYDAVNLVTSVDDQRTGVNTVEFAYDAHDKRVKTTFPMTVGNPLIERTKYDDGGLLLCRYSYRLATTPLSAETGDPDCPGANATGLITYHKYSYTTPSGVKTNTRYKMTEKGAWKTDYTYDPIGRLTTATTTSNSGRTTARKFTYTYDRHSNLIKDQVTLSSTPTLANRTTTLAYNDADELCWSLSGTSTNGCSTTPTGATAYTWDGAGALTGDNQTSPLALTYNVIGQNDSIDPAGTTYGPIDMSYTGVTQDRRTLKGDLRMSYGFSGLSSQGTNSGVPHSEYFVRDPNGALIAMVGAKENNTVVADRYYLTDALHSVVATVATDGSVRRYLYEPYGRQIRTWTDNATGISGVKGTYNSNDVDGTGADTLPPDGSLTAVKPEDNASEYQPWRFASGYLDGETGMLKFGTRYYMPNAARFTQVDPKAGSPANPTTLNSYLYTGCNPVNRTDASGRDWTDNDYLYGCATGAGMDVVLTGAAIAIAGKAGPAAIAPSLLAAPGGCAEGVIGEWIGNTFGTDAQLNAETGATGWQMVADWVKYALYVG